MDRRGQPSRPTGASREEHPDLLRLDAVRAGEGTPADQAHVAACPVCRSTVEGFRGLAAEIRKEVAPEIGIPAEVDELVRAHARGAQLCIRRKRWATRHWRSLSAAAAAAVFLLVALWQPWVHPSALERPMLMRAEAPSPGSTVGDVDRSGTVDILDAFFLARQVEGEKALDLSWDVNGDGLVDVQDVDAVADLAVTLDGGEG